MNLSMKHENKCKRKGIRVLPALGEENLTKKNGGKWQKIDVKPCLSRREREKFEILLKSEFEQVKISF